MAFLDAIKALYRRRAPVSSKGPSQPFQARYAGFKALLAANTELLNIIADIEDNLQGRWVFGLSYIRAQASRAMTQAKRMVAALDAVSGGKYTVLQDVLVRIEADLQALIGQSGQARPEAMVLTYDRVTKEMVDWVGGKNANLGEMHGVLHLPIPAGFAVTTQAFDRFMAHAGLGEAIQAKLATSAPGSQASIPETGAAIREMIQAAPLPKELEADLRQAAGQLAARQPEPGVCRLAMRSSAIGEDSQLTFAGQYRSDLNVPVEKVPESYRRIVASLYSDQAMMYRSAKGVRDAHIAMGVACLRMVPSVASGVLYSRDPADPRHPHIIINAVWGLGPYAVDGVVSTDLYVVDRKHIQILTRQVVHKPFQLIMQAGAGLCEAPVPTDRRDAPCLTDAQILQLAEYAIRLEVHYGTPQDIEWALTPEADLILLQTRPLPTTGKKQNQQSTMRYEGYRVLAEGGVSVYPGVGYGPAYHVTSDEALQRFPEGAVLVARRSAPRLVMAMNKARAIVTEVGSITGHMASLAREFKVPTILEVKSALSRIAHGSRVTVDAYAGVVYQGEVPPLTALAPPAVPAFQDTTLYRTLRRTADLIVPLHLADPKSPDFGPAACRTVHDIMRVAHELCYAEMFQLGDSISGQDGNAIKLDLPLPVDLYLIDLGGALLPEALGQRKVHPTKLASTPLKALIQGMTHEAFMQAEPRPVALSGFFAVMSEQLLSPPAQSEAMGDRSYAIASDNYLNFSSRIGYHYSILDCCCAENINKNYITFSFKGGAADEVRRNRRARAIARILGAMDFSVEVKSDQVDARLVKYECGIIEKHVERLGSLLQFSRQMDMLMNTEASVEAAAQAFLKGTYRLPLTGG